MSPDIPDLVETSSNLARIVYKDGHLHMASLQRSAVESSKMDLAGAIRACWATIGAKAVHSGSYLGWAPNPDSDILKVLEAQYKRCLLYTSPSPRDRTRSRMPSSA